MTSQLPKLLIIDDSPEDRQTYRYYLEPDYVIVEAELGRTGLDLMRELAPDCVLLDYRLPDMSGLDVLAALAQDPSLPSTAVVLLTGNADTRVAIAAMKAGALDFVEKAEAGSEAIKRVVAHAIEKARLQGALEQQRLWLDATLSSVTTGILATDGQGRITIINDSAATLLGCGQAEAIGQPLDAVLHLVGEDAGQDWRDHLARVLSRATEFGVSTQQARLMASDGHAYDVEYLIKPLSCQSQRLWGAVMTLRDVTARKLADQRLREAKQTAEHASQAKSEFLATMSHELRTPLNAIMGLAQVLEKERLAPDQRDMVAHIGGAGRFLLGLIDDILDFSKIEAGQLRIEAQPFQLQTVLYEVDSVLGATARQQGLELHINELKEVPGRLVGDAFRLKQILINLVGNAVKFTQRGAVDLSVQLGAATPTTQRLRFTIRDTGIGIAPECLPTLFDPFTQVDTGNTRRFSGAGLGLSICKRLVETMKGNMGVESTLGSGSTFWFELPFARPAAAEDVSDARFRPAVTQPTESMGSRLAGLRCLVVDDSPMNRIVLERALLREGAMVEQAADGRQALDKLKALPDGVDIVFMDIQMPVLDGLAATRALRQDMGLTDLPVIAVTAGVMPEQRQAALAAGVDAFMGKPVIMDQLVETILGLRRRQQSSG